jgi:putative Holliday junction resolvase
MRILGVDYGRRRIGLALSDASAVLARPWQTIAAAAKPAASAALVADALARFARETLGEDPAEAVVVGLPRRLNGDDTSQTQAVRIFAAALGQATGLPVHLQDERLTSREAESRLSLLEPDWRERKKKLDAAAAAIILQDYLDAHARPHPADPAWPS